MRAALTKTAILPLGAFFCLTDISVLPKQRRIAPFANYDPNRKRCTMSLYSSLLPSLSLATASLELSASEFSSVPSCLYPSCLA